MLHIHVGRLSVAQSSQYDNEQTCLFRILPEIASTKGIVDLPGIPHHMSKCSTCKTTPLDGLVPPEDGSYRIVEEEQAMQRLFKAERVDCTGLPQYGTPYGP